MPDRLEETSANRVTPFPAPRRSREVRPPSGRDRRTTSIARPSADTGSRSSPRCVSSL